MTVREFVFENAIGDLEYHPRRAVIYLVFGGACAAVWILASSEAKLNLTPLIFSAGAATLLLKSIFLLRKTSDGLSVSRTLDLSQHESESLMSIKDAKRLPSVPIIAAQLVQDFGAGGLLLGPVLHAVNVVDRSRMNVPSLGVIIAGASVYIVGWLIRRMFATTSSPNQL